MNPNVEKSGNIFHDRPLVKPISETIETVLEQGVELLREKTPIRTGVARDGWFTTRSPHGITNSVPYVKFLEEGTRYTEGHWMVRETTPKIERLLVDALGKSILEAL
jgi:hypothetical protein